MIWCSTVKCKILFFLKAFENVRSVFFPPNVAGVRSVRPESYLPETVVKCIKSIGSAMRKPSSYFGLDAWPSKVFLGFLGVENTRA